MNDEPAVSEEATPDSADTSSLPEELATLLSSHSRRETLGEVLTSMFVVKGSNAGSVATFIVSFLSFGWFIDSLLPLIQEAGLRMGARLWGMAVSLTAFRAILTRAALPALIFLGVLLVLYFNRRRNTESFDYESVVPDLHQGLIVMLSPYSKRAGKDGYESPVDIVNAIDAKALDLDKLLSGCNWGQLAFVVRYHAPTLKHCWVIVTKRGSAETYRQAERLIKHLAEGDVQCHKTIIENENEISEIASVVGGLYKTLTAGGKPLSASDVIADFTGGTAAMSAGMIIATLNENEEIEYVNQRIALTSAIDREQVRAQKIIISPRTSLRMVRVLTGR